MVLESNDKRTWIGNEPLLANWTDTICLPLLRSKCFSPEVDVDIHQNMSSQICPPMHLGCGRKRGNKNILMTSSKFLYYIGWLASFFSYGDTKFKKLLQSL